MQTIVCNLSTITADHSTLAGHFPANPIAPGVVLSDNVVQLLQQWRPDLRLAGLTQIKFLLPLRPNKEFMISLTQTNPVDVNWPPVVKSNRRTKKKLGINNQLMDTYDVIVIGGGPAGSTAASLLADKGWSVCILEKARHPRFHIGESLLPMNLPIFEELGVLDEIHQIGIKKYAAEFNSPDTCRPLDTFYFRESLTQNPAYAFQVRRSEFDHLLLNNSKKKGATVLEGIRVSSVNLNQHELNKITAVDSAGNEKLYACHYIVDASGRDTFLSTKLKLKRKIPHHRMAAIFGHFKNVSRRNGNDAGNISIYWFKHGWMWMIPLQHNVMSVGSVCWPDYIKTRKTPLNEFLTSTINHVPEMAKRMQHAKAISNVTATANYAYSSTRMHGDGYVLVGDAYAFIDPVFSSGVYLAMRSAVLGAKLVDTDLRSPNQKAAVAQIFQNEVKQGIRSFSWFIFRFNAHSMRHLLMHNPGKNASPRFKTIKAAVISVFSGDVFERPELIVPLWLFKTHYYLLSVMKIKDSFIFLKRRLINATSKLGQ